MSTIEFFVTAGTTMGSFLILSKTRSFSRSSLTAPGTWSKR